MADALLRFIGRAVRSVQAFRDVLGLLKMLLLLLLRYLILFSLFYICSFTKLVKHWFRNKAIKARVKEMCNSAKFKSIPFKNRCSKFALG